MAKNKKVEMNLEEKLEKALVPVEEQAYKIPNNWVWTRLGEVINIFRGLSYTKNDEVEEGYLVLRGNNLTDKGLTFLENIYVNEKIAKKGVEVKKDDVVLVASTGSSKVIGRACIVEQDYEKTTIGAFLLLCRPEEIIMKNWVHYIFKTLRYRLYISEQAKGTNIKNIKNEYLENFSIPLPPLNEQKRIVEKLDFLFDKTEKAKEIIEGIKIDIENRKISILDRAFKGVLTSKWRNENKVSDVKELLKLINDKKIKRWEEDCLQAEKDGNKKPKKPIIKEIEDMIVPVEEQPYKIPDSWVWVKLDNLCSKITDGTHKTPKYTDSGVPFISVKDIYDNQVSFDNTKFISQEEHNELYKRCNPEYDDILLTKSGTIGRTAVIKTQNEFSLFVSVALLKNYKNIIDSSYLSLNIQDFFNKININQTIKGGVIKNYHITDMKEQLVPLPPLEEQQEIVRILDEVLENENKVKELLELEERIDILEKSILNKAFKGELGTQNNSDEPALELLKKII